MRGYLVREVGDVQAQDYYIEADSPKAAALKRSRRLRRCYHTSLVVTTLKSGYAQNYAWLKQHTYELMFEQRVLSIEEAK